jgi:hypothetical protein
VFGVGSLCVTLSIAITIMMAAVIVLGQIIEMIVLIVENR